MLQTNGRKVRVGGAVAALHLAAFCNQNEDGSCSLHKREAVAMNFMLISNVCVHLKSASVLVPQWPAVPRLQGYKQAVYWYCSGLLFQDCRATNKQCSVTAVAC